MRSRPGWELERCKKLLDRIRRADASEFGEYSEEALALLSEVQKLPMTKMPKKRQKALGKTVAEMLLELPRELDPPGQEPLFALEGTENPSQFDPHCVGANILREIRQSIGIRLGDVLPNSENPMSDVSLNKLSEGRAIVSNPFGNLNALEEFQGEVSVEIGAMTCRDTQGALRLVLQTGSDTQADTPFLYIGNEEDMGVVAHVHTHTLSSTNGPSDPDDSSAKHNRGITHGVIGYFYGGVRIWEWKIDQWVCTEEQKKVATKLRKLGVLA